MPLHIVWCLNPGGKSISLNMILLHSPECEVLITDAFEVSCLTIFIRNVELESKEGVVETENRTLLNVIILFSFYLFYDHRDEQQFSSIAAKELHNTSIIILFVLFRVEKQRRRKCIQAIEVYETKCCI